MPFVPGTFQEPLIASAPDGVKAENQLAVAANRKHRGNS
jgi:hypothetical protein